MRKNIFKIIVLIVLVASFDACQKDSENDPSVPDRDKFLGTWSTHSVGSNPSSLDFTMTITAGSSSASQVLIKNFENEGSSTTTTAEISGSSISIPQQVVNSDTIQGNGTYNSNNTITLNYTMRDGQTVDNRTATAHK
jgi:hypothetical protein